QNNPKRGIRLFLDRKRPRPVLRRFVPFHGVTAVFPEWPRALLALRSNPVPYGGSCFSQSERATPRGVPHPVLMATRSHCLWMVDALVYGSFSKPSDGMRAHFDSRLLRRRKRPVGTSTPNGSACVNV